VSDFLQRCAADFLFFCKNLHIPGIGRFGDHWCAFQERDLAAMAPMLMAAAHRQPCAVNRAWRERTKGASKDTDLALAIMWLLLFGHPEADIRIRVGAYDQDQARETRQIIEAVKRVGAPLNRLLSEQIIADRNEIKCRRNGAVCHILTADPYGTHGSRPSMVLINELSHIQREQFAQTLIDDADKVPHCVVLIATNAGVLDTWQYRWRQIAEQSPRWDFSAYSQPAPWISRQDLRESQQRNPAHRYQRLWLGQWVPDKGDALAREDILAAIDERLSAAPRRHHDWMCVSGLDLASKRDHAALVTLAVTEGRIRLVDCRSWAPVEGRVPLMRVEAAVRRCHETFGGPILYDPAQAELMAQRLESIGANLIEYTMTPRHHAEMASALLQVFTERRVDLYHDEVLLRDLQHLNITERSWGFKIDPPRDDYGHGDRGMAFCIALAGAAEALELPASDEPWEITAATV